MEEIDAIVAALVAGTSAGLSKTMAGAVKDLYAALKSRVALLLERHAAGSEKALTEALSTAAEDPERARRELTELLAAIGAGRDSELVTNSVMFNKGVVVGDFTTQHNTFH
ncbi:hypothetical protein [Kutzneria buriramensis]|uniref:Uncharacterized protein n=1 Tax=Kutzneria buriramensis TaxID=1045776 RepID=A0A3E0I6U0_9PSEU|nr:hypothetical protein [Kutzneria buriramensis]REH54331.1 hypothetical protein BCF44_102563 [Kutzneria buriramensis]